MPTKYKYEGSKYTLDKILNKYLNTIRSSYISMEEMQGDMFVSDLNTIIKARYSLERVLTEVAAKRKAKKKENAKDYHHYNREGIPVFVPTPPPPSEDVDDEDYTTVEEEQKIPERY